MIPDHFSRLATWAGQEIGRPRVFLGVLLLCIAINVAALNPVWQESINTWVGSLTGQISILLLVVLQNTTNRAAMAQQIKADEAIRSSAADNRYIGIEELTDKELEELRAKCRERALRPAHHATSA